VGGVRTNLQRVVITDASGGVLADTFVGPDGGPVPTPAEYDIGACGDLNFMGDQILCDDTGPFLRKYVQTILPNGQPSVVTIRDFTLAGAGYTPVGDVRVCEPGDRETLGAVCYSLQGAPDVVLNGFLGQDDDGVTVLYDQDGDIVPVGTYAVVQCLNAYSAEEVLCDEGNGGHPFVRRYIYTPQGNLASQTPAPADFELDGFTPYVAVGPIGTCAPQIDVNDPFGATEEVVCDLGAVPITSFIRRTILDANGVATATVNVLSDGTLYAPIGPVSLGACDECCPIVISDEICYDDGTGLKHATSVRQPDGTILLLDQATGAVVDPGDVVACAQPETARARLLAAGQSWTPGGDVTGTLVAVSATGITGTYQVTDGEGNVSGPYPAGYTNKWSNDKETGSLIGPNQITADAASTVGVAWIER